MMVLSTLMLEVLFAMPPPSPTPLLFESAVLAVMVTFRSWTVGPMTPNTSMPPPLPCAVFPLIVLFVMVTGPSKIPMPPPAPSLAVPELTISALFALIVLSVTVSVPAKFSIPPPALTLGKVSAVRLFRMIDLLTLIVELSLKMPPPAWAALSVITTPVRLTTPGDPVDERA
jgi:hypothetical protein